MNIDDNYIILGKLIRTEPSETSLIAKTIKDPNSFLAFCKSLNLSAFLYSIFSEKHFKDIFPNANQFATEYKKHWAINLRHNVIRDELNKNLNKIGVIDYIFLDSSLCNRFDYGNRFILIENVIKLLIPNLNEFQNALEILPTLGFKKLENNKIVDTKNQKTSVLFKRNEFTISINLTLPVLMHDQFNHSEISSRKKLLNVTEKSYPIADIEDRIDYNLMKLFDCILLNKDLNSALLDSYLILKKQNSIIEFPQTKTNELLNSLANFCLGVFENKTQVNSISKYCTKIFNQETKQKWFWRIMLLTTTNLKAKTILRFTQND